MGQSDKHKVTQPQLNYPHMFLPTAQVPTCQRHVRRLPWLEAPQPSSGAVGTDALLDTVPVHRLLVALGRVHVDRGQQEQQKREEKEAGPYGEHDGYTPGHGGRRAVSDSEGTAERQRHRVFHNGSPGLAGEHSPWCVAGAGLCLIPTREKKSSTQWYCWPEVPIRDVRK